MLFLFSRSRIHFSKFSKQTAVCWLILLKCFLLRTKENAYNSALSHLDKLYREMLDTERELADMAEHMLLGVATRYGKSSVEYGMAGGVPKNQRRKGLRGNSLNLSSEQPSIVASMNGIQNGSKATSIT
jgi:hypothetical protein